MDTTIKIKLFIENTTKGNQLGGGWTFIRNLVKGLGDKVQLVNTIEECDIFFIFGITTLDKGNFYKAKELGKKIVLRADNIPRKSRNKRQTPYERLSEFGNKADAVVYQSQWCKEYAGYFIRNSNELIINNGVDTSLFNPGCRESDGNTYLYINYNDNPNKRFDEAIYRFDMEWRKNNKAHLIIAGNMPKIYLEHPEYNWDLTSKAKVDYYDITTTPEETASLMNVCDYLLFPSFAEAYPNTLLEAIACGIEPLCINNEGGSEEVMINSYDDRHSEHRITEVKSIQEMSNEYLELFEKL